MMDVQQVSPNKIRFDSTSWINRTRQETLTSFVEAFSGEQIFIDEPTIPEYQALFTKEQLTGAKK